MPGGLMGTTPTAPSISSTVNPTQALQTPLLGEAWRRAGELYQDPNRNNQYYPGQTLADFHSAIPEAYQNMINDQWQQRDAGQTGLDAFLQGVGGGFGYGSSPATGYFADAAAGGGGAADMYSRATGYVPTAATQGMYDTVGWAAQDNPGSAQLRDVAAGKYVNQNPYLDAAIAAAQRPTIRAFQTSVWPGIDMNAEGAGRYGSGVMTNQRDRAEDILGTSLGETANKFALPAYMAERTAQDTAAGSVQQNALDRIRAQQAGYTGAGSLGLQSGQLLDTSAAGLDTAERTRLLGATGLQSAFDTGNRNILSGMQLLPQIQAGVLTPEQSLLAGGQGLTGLNQAQIQDQMNRFYGTRSADQSNLTAYLNAIGQPTSGSGTRTETNYTNPVANALSMATGGLGLARGIGNTFGGAGGSGGLFSAGGLLGSQGSLFGTAADASIAAGGPPLAAEAGKTAANAAPLLLAA